VAGKWGPCGFSLGDSGVGIVPNLLFIHAQDRPEIDHAGAVFFTPATQPIWSHATKTATNQASSVAFNRAKLKLLPKSRLQCAGINRHEAENAKFLRDFMRRWRTTERENRVSKEGLAKAGQSL
jgi:hypothetical protein